MSHWINSKHLKNCSITLSVILFFGFSFAASSKEDPFSRGNPLKNVSATSSSPIEGGYLFAANRIERLLDFLGLSGKKAPGMYERGHDNDNQFLEIVFKLY